MKILPDRYMPNPYPQQPNDGTWEGEGGYVAKPDHVVWSVRVDDYWGYAVITNEEMLIAHPLTVAEINYAIEKQR